jgi:hypothetical protein
MMKIGSIETPSLVSIGCSMGQTVGTMFHDIELFWGNRKELGVKDPARQQNV